MSQVIVDCYINCELCEMMNCCSLAGGHKGVHQCTECVKEIEAEARARAEAELHKTLEVYVRQLKIEAEGVQIDAFVKDRIDKMFEILSKLDGLRAPPVGARGRG